MENRDTIDKKEETLPEDTITIDKNEEVFTEDDPLLEKDKVLLQMEAARKWIDIRRFIKSPQQQIRKEPAYAILISIPIALIFLVLGGLKTGFTPAFDNVLLFTILIAIVPPGFLHHLRRRRVKGIEQYFPNFLRDVAEMNRSGMTLTKSVGMVSKGEYGDLTIEIARINAMLSWGISFEDALDKFADRVATPLIYRSIALINQASRAGGNVPDVLEVAAKDAYVLKMMEKDRASNMIIYVVISYMSFFVFLLVIGILSYSFIPVMAQAGISASAAGGGAEEFMGVFNPELFRRLFFHASLIQGFSSGLVAGQMGEGEVMAGLKHSVILSLIAWVSFTFFI
ncbi:MAG: type II secretion system F family protein [Methanosarcinales archaeon]|nr:type II secretion system F family protein [Methanosarcinales archaeon]